VNDAPIFVKGANLAALDAVPERATVEKVRKLLTFAAEANMNMLRVWGQGDYAPDYLLELADRLGILIWQDFQFGNRQEKESDELKSHLRFYSMYPATDTFLAGVKKEALHQVRRMQHHASLALLCGNNENEAIDALQ